MDQVVGMHINCLCAYLSGQLILSFAQKRKLYNTVADLGLKVTRLFFLEFF